MSEATTLTAPEGAETHAGSGRPVLARDALEVAAGRTTVLRRAHLVAERVELGAGAALRLDEGATVQAAALAAATDSSIVVTGPDGPPGRDSSPGGGNGGNGGDGGAAADHLRHAGPRRTVRHRRHPRAGGWAAPAGAAARAARGCPAPAAPPGWAGAPAHDRW